MKARIRIPSNFTLYCTPPGSAHSAGIVWAGAAITGTPRRPRTALLQLPDGRRRQTPQLDAVQARAISDALTVQEPPRSDPQETGLLVLSVPLAAEARVGTSHRHSTIRFARVKADQ